MENDDFRDFLAQRFPLDSRTEGREVMLRLRVVPEALRAATQRGLVVLGMEGFKVDDHWISPQLDYIADLSSIEGPWAERVRASSRAALEIVARWPDTIDYVELVVAQPDAN